jgi:hypothetical protein
VPSREVVKLVLHRGGGVYFTSYHRASHMKLYERSKSAILPDNLLEKL